MRELFLGEKVYETVIPRNVRVSGGAVPRKAGASIRFEMCRQPSVPKTSLGSHSTRAPFPSRLIKVAEFMPEPTSRSHEPRQRLGRGLAALLGNPKMEGARPEISGVKQVPIEFIRTSVRNPRQDFNEVDLEDLAASIRERGIIQPIIVRPIVDVGDAYEIVAGERRWRAAQRAEQHSVPVIVLQLTDRESWSSRSSRMSSAPISTPLKRREVTPNSPRNLVTIMRTSGELSARAEATSPTRFVLWPYPKPCEFAARRFVDSWRRSRLAECGKSGSDR